MKRPLLFLILLLFPLTAFAQGKKAVEIVFIGNSITQGARLAHPETEGPAPQTVELLREEGYDVKYANRGRSGTTTYDWLPGSGKCFGPMIAAADGLFTPEAEHVFSVMLGTNDSAETRCNGAPVSAEQYEKNVCTIIDTLLTRYPDARIVLNFPIWYSPTTHNGARYLQAGLDRLQTYHPVIRKIAKAYRKRVFTGNKKAFKAFRNHPELFDEENGNSGKFYLHPNATGARLLATYWEKGVKRVIR